NFTPLNAYSGNTNENYDNNVQPLLSQISSSFPTAYDINSNISVRDYHHLINGELSYTGSFWENFNMFSPEQLYLPLPNYNVEMAYEQNTSVTSGGLSDNSQVYNFNSGNVNVHINGNPISPEIFSLGYYFNYFKTTFENLYSGSIV